MRCWDNVIDDFPQILEILKQDILCHVLHFWPCILHRYYPFHLKKETPVSIQAHNRSSQLIFFQFSYTLYTVITQSQIILNCDVHIRCKTNMTQSFHVLYIQVVSYNLFYYLKSLDASILIIFIMLSVGFSRHHQHPN